MAMGGSLGMGSHGVGPEHREEKKGMGGAERKKENDWSRGQKEYLGRGKNYRHKAES